MTDRPVLQKVRRQASALDQTTSGGLDISRRRILLCQDIGNRDRFGPLVSEVVVVPTFLLQQEIELPLSLLQARELYLACFKRELPLSYCKRESCLSLARLSLAARYRAASLLLQKRESYFYLAARARELQLSCCNRESELGCPSWGHPSLGVVTG